MVQNLETPAPKERMYFDLMDKVGSMGRYQKITIIFWSVVSYLCGGLLLVAPFLFYQDPYECPITYANMTCDEYVCSLPKIERGLFVPPPSMTTLGNKFGDNRCQGQMFNINMVQTIMYSSTLLGYIVLTLIGGCFGRKSLMVFGMTLCMVGLIVTIFAVDIWMAGVALFAALVGVQFCFSICFIFISETVAESHRQKFSVIIQLFYGFGVLSNVGTYFLLRNWQLVFIYFYLIPTVLVLLGIIFLVVDTPMCLVNKMEENELLDAFLFIARINSIENPVLTLDDVKAIKQFEARRQEQSSSTAKNFSVIDLFRYPSLRMMTVFLVILQCTISFIFYAPELMLSQFHLDIFINGLVMGVSQLIAYPLCYFMITRCKRTHTAYGCFITTLVCSIALIFLWHPRSDGVDVDLIANIGVLVLFFFMRLAISMEYTFFFVYFNELYPTQVRVIGTSLVTLMGGAMVTISPFLIDACLRSELPIMALFAIMSFLSILGSCKLPETYQIPPPDIIEELMSQGQNNPETERKLHGGIQLQPLSTRQSSNS